MQRKLFVLKSVETPLLKYTWPLGGKSFRAWSSMYRSSIYFILMWLQDRSARGRACLDTTGGRVRKHVSRHCIPRKCVSQTKAFIWVFRISRNANTQKPRTAKCFQITGTVSWAAHIDAVSNLTLLPKHRSFLHDVIEANHQFHTKFP